MTLPADFLLSSVLFDSAALPGFCHVTVGDTQTELPVNVLETSELLGRLLIMFTVLNFTDHTSDVTVGNKQSALLIFIQIYTSD